MYCRRFVCSNYIILICLAVFDFQRLFRLLYRQHFFRIFWKIFEFDNQIVFRCFIFEKILTAQFQTVEINLQNSALLRAEALRLDFKYLKQLRTYLIYLNCLRRKFEYVLSCKYAICNICFQILESNLESQKLYFCVNKCVICSQKIFVVERIKSVTTDFRILSIDDNNIRNIVSLKFFRLLQNIIELAFFIQDFFDQIFDTNSNKYWYIFFILYANQYCR